MKTRIIKDENGTWKYWYYGSWRKPTIFQIMRLK